MLPPNHSLEPLTTVRRSRTCKPRNMSWDCSTTSQRSSSLARSISHGHESNTGNCHHSRKRPQVPAPLRFLHKRPLLHQQPRPQVLRLRSQQPPRLHGSRSSESGSNIWNPVSEPSTIYVYQTRFQKSPKNHVAAGPLGHRMAGLAKPARFRAIVYGFCCAFLTHEIVDS